MKAFVVNVNDCVGCRACQVGCKDEHCGNEWSPYTKSQPEVGQFWLKVNQQERGKRPHVKVTYLPVLCQHCENAPCMKVATNGAVYGRDDGLVLIDPVKAKGQRKIMQACPYNCVFWNEALDIPQKCTGCAHLLDGNHPVSIPRCVDNCHIDVIQFGEESELDLAGTEQLHPEYGTKPRVYYRGLPKKFVAGTVYDPDAQEVYIGATATLSGEAGTFSTTTDEWGDFWLRDLPEADFTLTITAAGKTKRLAVSTKEKDVGLDDIALS